MNVYDIAIIGTGVAGAFATYKIAKEHKDVKLLILDLGRPPMKRRRQLEGWLGCLPNSDGKLYLNNLDQVSKLVGKRSCTSSFKEVKNIFSGIDNLNITKDRNPLSSFSKKINKLGYEIKLNDYIQLYPKQIHSLSKKIASLIDDNDKVDCVFDEEVLDITKSKKIFTIKTEEQEFKCKKIIFSVGRSGWRWAHKIYSKFGIVQNNNVAKYGIRIETDAINLKDLNKSSCSLVRENEIEVGGFSWNGTVIPEDHVDCAITSFRSNEDRWHSDKVSFNLIGHRSLDSDKAVEEIDRIAKLTFLLANDRVLKEKVSSLMTNKSKISIMKEYTWIPNYLQELNEVIPNLIAKSHFHFPTILPMPSEINIYNNLETDIDGMFVAGECSGISGILSAACTGIVAAEKAVK
jgi:uncharacterized FAD-dependent dehydrogenase